MRFFKGKGWTINPGGWGTNINYLFTGIITSEKTLLEKIDSRKLLLKSCVMSSYFEFQTVVSPLSYTLYVYSRLFYNSLFFNLIKCRNNINAEKKKKMQKYGW